jgi:putative ABC transport system substrate-binding protein
MLLHAARAQRPMPVIGFLDPTSSENNAIFFRAFREGLKEAGYVEGKNVAILYRSAENQTDSLPALAADLVRRRVEATFSNGALAAKARCARVSPSSMVTPCLRITWAMMVSLSPTGSPPSTM